MIKNLTKTEMINILQSQNIGRLGCTDGKHPYVVPVTYFFDGKIIFVQSEEGKKINIMRKNPNVCIQVDIVTGLKNYKSVLVNGHYEELKFSDSQKAVELLEANIFSKMTRSRIHHFEHHDDKEIIEKNEKKLITFSIIIDEITGRSENA